MDFAEDVPVADAPIANDLPESVKRIAHSLNGVRKGLELVLDGRLSAERASFADFRLTSSIFPAINRSVSQVSRNAAATAAINDSFSGKERNCPGLSAGSNHP